MDVDEMRAVRDQAVANMQNLLEETERTDLPYWVLMSLMLPLFFGAAINMTCRLLWILLKGWITSPFSFLMAWADMIGILWWFLRGTVERMRK